MIQNTKFSLYPYFNLNKWLPSILYHTTKAAYLSSILENGLVYSSTSIVHPRQQAYFTTLGDRWETEYKSPFVCFTGTLKEARMYLPMAENDDGIIFRFDGKRMLQAGCRATGYVCWYAGHPNIIYGFLQDIGSDFIIDYTVFTKSRPFRIIDGIVASIQ